MIMDMFVEIVGSVIVALLAVHWVFPSILKIAKVKGLVDNPNARKLQKEPVPVLGGIAVFFGIVMGMLAYTALRGNGMDNSVMDMLPVMLGTSVMLYVGSLDDILGLSPKVRLGLEVVVMLGVIFGSGLCVDSLHGLWGMEEFSWWIAVPLTVFAGVGLINAYNMVDGVNGLSSGLCIACSVIMAVICWKRGDYADCVLSACFAASLVPFFMHNVFGRRSKMFIGDGGTMVMGLLMGWYVIRTLSSDNAESIENLAANGRELGLVAMMVAVASVPVADTLRVMTARMARGVSPFRPDKTHLHHVFIACGVSHWVTTASEVMINMAVVAAWYATYRMGATVDCQLYVVVAASIVMVWGSYFYLSRVVRKHPDSRLLKMTSVTHTGNTAWWTTLQRWLDKGMYEDYSVVIKNMYNKTNEDMNNKEKDMAAIVNYLQGRGVVEVEEILEQSGAERLRVYPILFELEQEGLIEVVEREAPGGTKKVTYVKR